MENLYGTDNTACSLGFDVVADLVGPEKEYDDTSCQILEVAAKCHAYRDTCRGEQGGKTGGIDTQRADYRDEKQNHHQDIEQTPEEGLDGRLYLATLHHVVHHPVYKRYNSLADEEDDGCYENTLACLDAEVYAMPDKLAEVIAVAADQLTGDLLGLGCRIGYL